MILEKTHFLKDMPLSITYILYSLSYGLLGIIAFKIFSWLNSYFKKVKIINKIKGPTIIPFIGNAHIFKQKHGK